MPNIFKVFDLQAVGGFFSSLLTANAGITSNNSPITVNAGLNVTAGTSSFHERPKVNGTDVSLVTDIVAAPASPIKAWVNFDGGDHVGVVYSNGTCSRSAGSNFPIVNISNHGLVSNNIVYLSFDGTKFTDGLYTVQVINNDQFSIYTEATTLASNNVYLALITPRAGENIKNISKFGADSDEDLKGRYVVNFDTPLQDQNYAITAAGYQTYQGTSRTDSNGAVNGRPLSSHSALITVVSFGSNLENWRYIMASFIR